MRRSPVLRCWSALLSCLLLAACAATPPPCPYEGPPDTAPSAGCLAIIHGRLLVVSNADGLTGPPGGSAHDNESAQCAAHRETFEETGLDLLPRQLLRTFDTGFNLYYCEIHSGSGAIEPRSFFEVQRAYWLPLEDFGRVEWRFPGQGQELEQMLRAAMAQ
jgi:8-oxo-dGTP pyrophosphatase MutT (NUDIX family)